MEKQRICSDCFMLVQNKRTFAHPHLVEINHVYNDTLFECNNCHSLLRLTHVPHQWHLIENEQQEPKPSPKFFVV